MHQADVYCTELSIVYGVWQAVGSESPISAYLP